MPIDDRWLSEWFYRLDQATRTNAITELRTEQEKAVVEINRELTDGIRHFARLLLQLWALKDTHGVISTNDIEGMFLEARELETKTRALEDQLETARKKFAAFEELERAVSRMR